jgi:hypothetical protein
MSIPPLFPFPPAPDAEFPAIECRFSRACGAHRSYDAFHRQPREKGMKELSYEEVLRIAGGLPVPAALDEITYRAPTDPDPERLLPGRIQQPHSSEEHP